MQLNKKMENKFPKKKTSNPLENWIARMRGSITQVINSGLGLSLEIWSPFSY